MSKQKITALRQALGNPPGPHLDPQRLAELVTAEVAGEPIEKLYPATLAHLEHCLACAQAYSELMTLAQTTTENMASAAAAIPPQAVYAAFLQQAAPTTPPQLIQSLVVQLPLHFTTTPASAADVSQQLVQTAVHQLSPTDPPDLAWATRLLQAIRQDLPILRLYLESAAATAWERLADLHVNINGRPFPLQPSPTFSIHEERTVWYAAPESIEVQVTRLSPLACRLTVRLHAASPTPQAGRSISIRILHTTQTAKTDEHGIAHFEPLPIAVLPQLTIHTEP